MLVRIHRGYRMAVAICDRDLIGKRFEDSKKQLDLKGDFFKGEEKSKQEVIEIIKDALREDASFNIVGKKSCSLAKEIGLIRDSGILYIDSIPVALILL